MISRQERKDERSYPTKYADCFRLKGSQTSFEEKHEKTAKNRTKNNLRNRWVEK
jgi:hypothetical protein